MLQVTHFNGVRQKNFAVHRIWRNFAVRLNDASARMAELVDALDSKSCDSNIVRVRFPLWAHKKGRNKRPFLCALIIFRFIGERTPQTPPSSLRDGIIVPRAGIILSFVTYLQTLPLWEGLAAEAAVRACWPCRPSASGKIVPCGNNRPSGGVFPQNFVFS